jgi:eukaryotic-like serine/threonine-protein kinase
MLSPGARLGPYEIVSPLGAGAMGEVYRARDPRLGRDVAIKVLPPGFAADSDRLRRFEAEARAVAALNHPNVIAVYDVGSDAGRPFLVTELLQGETLRGRLLEGPLPPRLAIELAVQIARGLAAAHDTGIVHRDLKPENVFVARDRRVKILDFGLAKQVAPETSASSASTRLSAQTEAGLVIGTAGYMAPEQVRGETADHRADLFAFGAILYELASGRRAFHAPTSAETMSAILNSDPLPMSSASRPVPPALERIVRHCLEKDPRERYQSAHDLAFHLQGLLDSADAGSGRTPAGAAARLARWAVPAAVVIGLGGGLLVGKPIWIREAAAPPSFHRVTFRSGFVWSARFAPDGRTIVYSASWAGGPLETFSTRPESPESRSLGLSNSNILSISQSGEMAVLVHANYVGGWAYQGTLARLPLEGGAPREILNGVLWADWAPRGGDLAVARQWGGKCRLEYPIGTPLYETAGMIREPRFSPSGDRIAFLDQLTSTDDRGAVAILDRSGKVTRLTGLWKSVQGLCWALNGNEIWFTAAESGPSRAVYAVSRQGRVRTILRPPGSLAIQDISRDGQVLLVDWTVRYGIAARTASDPSERDLSWLDWSQARDLSRDGTALLFTEGGVGGGDSYGVYLRRTDGSSAVRLGEGEALALSPDTRWALSILQGSQPRPVLLPTGAGQARTLPRGPIREYSLGTWMPDGEHVILLGSEAGHGSRYYIQDVNGGEPSPITPEGAAGFGFGAHVVSPDGTLLAAKGPNGKISLYPVSGGAPRPIPGLLDGEFPIRWSDDGRSLYAALPPPGRRTLELSKIDVRTGKRIVWRRLVRPEAADVTRIGNPLVAADGRAYAYTYGSHSSNLYLVGGLK